MGVTTRIDMQVDNTSLFLDLDQMKLINEPAETHYSWWNCVICFLTTIVNIWAIRVLKNKDNTYITLLMIADCVINIYISFEVMFFNFMFWFPLQNNVICALRSSTYTTALMFTRLVPVSIVLLRYISVCHPVFFQNNGREKGIWKWIMGSVIVLCLALWIYMMFNSSISFRFLHCMDRDQEFW